MEYFSEKVEGILFNLFSPEDVRKMSVVPITSPELYEGGNKPKFSGLFDTKMGPYDKNYRCLTCKQDYMKCPGHFSHIELKEPIYYIHHMNYLKKLLGCVCYTCSALMFDKTDERKMRILKKKNRQKKFQYIFTNLLKDCVHCGRKQTKYTKEGNLLYKIVSDKTKNKDSKMTLYADECLQILKRITDEDRKLLGFIDNKPSWLICEELPVPPPCIRPSVKHSINLRSEDDLTYKLLDIIKANNSLIQKYEKNDMKHINDYKEYLQYHGTTLIDNEVRGVAPAQHRSGRVLKGYKQRIKGKEGRIRGNLMGKRVDFSGRSVISPDPYLRIDQIGVPVKMAKILTKEEMVTEFNIENLQKYVDNGPDKHPGAKYIIDRKGVMRDIKYLDKPHKRILMVGMKVGRHMMDGDIVLFNRQPSLHKMSMMSHIVKIIPTKSFRFNPNVCNPYNADFDGDEMNIFTPRSEYTAVELQKMVHVPTQIITPQANKPVMGGIMDTVVGASHITMENIEISFSEMLDILGNVDSYDGNFNLEPVKEIDGVKYYSGRDVMSVILPKINYFKNAENEKDRVQINRGIWKNGMAKKEIIGSASGSLIHIIANDMGVYKAAQFLNEVQRVANTHLLNTGFSVSLGDCIATKEEREYIHTIIKKAKAEAQTFINLTQARAKSSKTIQLREEYENKMFGILNKARDDAGKYAKENLELMNGLNFMVNTGSKGNYINICQILAAVGQQSIADKDGQGRVPFGLEYRTTPHFSKFDDGPESRGFISHSYLEGLKPHEFFFHSMAGREGLIDTAVKTSETGYIQRRLIKAMEDVKIAYDGTVRNEINTIIQFVYGTDGFDAKSVERQYISLIMGSNVEFNNKFKWKRNELKQLNRKIKSKIIDKEYKMLTEIKAELMSKTEEDFIYIPINIYRIIEQSKKKYNLTSKTKVDIGPDEIIEMVSKKLKEMRILYDNHRLGDLMNKESLRTLKNNLRCHLASKKLLMYDKINREAFEWILRKIEEKFYKAVIHPGEMVGPISAQSIGERTTQLSVTPDTEVRIAIKGLKTFARIGDIIDGYMNIYNPIKTHITEDGKASHILPITKELDIKVPGLNYKTQEVEWRRVTEFSRHPVNGKLVRIKTKSGRTVTATLAHSFVSRNKEGNPYTIRGDELKVGMMVPIIDDENISLP